MSSRFREEDIGSQFESLFEDDEDFDEDYAKTGGARLTRKKSGVQFKEKPGLKKKPSMRELRKRTARPSKGGKGLAGMSDWKNELKKMNEEMKGEKKPTTQADKLKEEEKQKRIRVVSAKIHVVGAAVSGEMLALLVESDQSVMDYISDQFVRWNMVSV